MQVEHGTKFNKNTVKCKETSKLMSVKEKKTHK